MGINTVVWRMSQSDCAERVCQKFHLAEVTSAEGQNLEFIRIRIIACLSNEKYIRISWNKCVWKWRSWILKILRSRKPRHTWMRNIYFWILIFSLWKKEDILLSPFTKSLIPTEMSKEQSDNTKTPAKSSIIQRLRGDLGRSFIGTTATQLVWLL